MKSRDKREKSRDFSTKSKRVKEEKRDI